MRTYWINSVSMSICILIIFIHDHFHPIFRYVFCYRDGNTYQSGVEKAKEGKGSGNVKFVFGKATVGGVDFGREPGFFVYIMALGGYRVFYALNWMYKYVRDPTYSDPQSWIGGIIEIAFFADFLAYQFKGASLLRSAVLKVDDKVNEVVDQVEMKVGLKRESGFERVQTEEGTELRRRRAPGAEDEVPLGAAQDGKEEV